MGDVATVICGFVNDAPTSMNVSGIMGALYSPDFSISYHNFSGHLVNEVIDQQTERALEYRFAVPFMPRAMDLKLLITVFYEDVNTHHQFADSFFNQTVFFVEAPRQFDVRDYLPYVLGSLVSLVGVYVLRDLFFPQPKQVRSVLVEEEYEEAAPVVVAAPTPKRDKEAAAGASSKKKAEGSKRA